MKQAQKTRFFCSEQGLLSLEASIVVTIFIFFVLFLQSFFVIFEARNEMAHVTLATCNSLALDVYENENLVDSSLTLNFFLAISGNKKSADSAFTDRSFWNKIPKNADGKADGLWNGTIYASDEAKSAADQKAEDKAAETGISNTETRDIYGNSAGAVSSALKEAIQSRFIAYLSGGDTAMAERLLKRYHIKDGINGLDFSASYISSGKLYLSVKYNIEYTFNAFQLAPLRFEHTACSNLWN